MKRNLVLLLGGIAVAAIAFAASAQGAAGMQGTASPMASIGGAMPGTECIKARDPQRCEALQKAKETCKGKLGPEMRTCMENAMPPMDCAKARNPQRCEARQKAKEACKGKSGPERHQCMREHMPNATK